MIERDVRRVAAFVVFCNIEFLMVLGIDLACFHNGGTGEKRPSTFG
ncbi:hypothetical protein [Sphingobium tyrosinilyticum]|uniref:Uncharacterized protein n=1 Tax=Sphingobium tyrosinilyticum TaxID=2715436 RepID=A0ABV9EU58_9SPHN